MSLDVISLIGILIGLIGIMYLAYKGLSLLIVGPVMSFIVLLFALNALDPVEGLLGAYSSSFANFMKNNFLLFLFSSIFGKMTGDSGAGTTIAIKMAGLIEKSGEKNKTYKTIIVLTAITAVLTYGGINAFVVVFTMVSIMKPMFEELDIPWHYSIACIVFGAQSFVSSMLPGAPSVANLIPMKYLGTTPKAGPVLGILSAVMMIILGCIYLKWSIKKSEAKGERFLPTGAEISKLYTNKEDMHFEQESLIKALIPSIVLLAGLNIFDLEPIVALVIGDVVSYVLFKSKYENVGKTLSQGAENAAKTIVGVCAVVGFGGAVAEVPGYQMVVGALDKIPGPPIIQLVIAINVIAGITGSASGGIGIAMETFAKRFLDMGINPEIIHRMSVMSAYGIDSLPHNGSVINMLNTLRLTHKEGYGHVFWLTVAIPIIVVVFSIVLVQIGIV